MNGLHFSNQANEDLKSMIQVEMKDINKNGQSIDHYENAITPKDKFISVDLLRLPVFVCVNECVILYNNELYSNLKFKKKENKNDYVLEARTSQNMLIILNNNHFDEFEIMFL